MTIPTTIDLNCDLGEALPGVEDSDLMPLLSSCNIACGGHTGDRRSMRQSVRGALRHDVAIGAHPSYPDRRGFGRRSRELDHRSLRQSVLDQCRALLEITTLEGASIRHVKPHGALYNDLAQDEELAATFITAVLEMEVEVSIYGLAGSPFGEQVVAHGLRFVHEAFADRAYDDAGRLVPRSHESSLLTDPGNVLRQVETLLGATGRAPESLCIHSDTPGAAELLREIRTWLEDHDVEIRAPG